MSASFLAATFRYARCVNPVEKRPVLASAGFLYVEAAEDLGNSLLAPAGSLK
jgi:hypothetical protein